MPALPSSPTAIGRSRIWSEGSLLSVRPFAGSSLALLGRNRVAVHEVLEGTESSLGAVAGGDDDLLVRHGRSVPGCKDVGDRGAALGIDHNLPEFTEFNDTLQEVGVRQEPDLHEHPFGVHALERAGLAVFVCQSDDLATVDRKS